MSESTSKKGLRLLWPRILFAIPFAAVLWVPFYNRLQPELFGVPFYYWYQLAFVLVCAVIVAIVYRLERKDDRQA